MKKLVYVLVSVLLLSSYSGSPTKNTLYFWKLKGKVKTLIRHTYDFKVVDGKVVKGDPSGTISSHYSVVFNKTGNYTEFVNYSLDGKISVKEKFKRNDKGYLIEWFRDWPVDSLDEKGALKYDSEGNRMEVIYYSSDGSISSRQSFNYDNAGNAVSSTSYHSDGAIKWKQESTYDKNNNWISSNRYDAEGELIRKQVGKNNEHGNWVGGSTHIIEGDKKIKYSATYQYDKQGNWTEFVIYKDGNPSVMILREFTYY